MNEHVNTGNGESEEIPSASIVLTATTPTSITSTTKEKRGWFQSLTRRKKSQSQISLADIPSTSRESPNLQNNNNEPLQMQCANDTTTGMDNTTKELCLSGNAGRKRKDDKNLFQRLRKKMGLRFHSLRNRHDEGDQVDNGGSGTLDASAEFLTHSPIRETQLTFSFTQNTPIEEPDMVPFTHGYTRFIVKKWLEQEAGPNHIMYRACSEMLSQVWYWGEISRLDAQRQLSDKPTGSFLVRDSETRGCQFTLSFRIVNVTFHYRLEYRDGYWHFEELKYESIVKMIEDILHLCINDNFVCFVKVQNELQPPCPVILKYPLSRYLKMPHLQDLCRRVIQQHAASDEIAKLPVPPRLQKYLSINRELVFHS